MSGKQGKSKLWIIIVVIILVIILAIGGIFALEYLKNKNRAVIDVPLYEEYVEGEGFAADDELVVNKFTALEAGLKEYRNDEVGVRFGYLNNFLIPEDTKTSNDTLISIMKSTENSTEIEFQVGNIDTSQSDIDHIESQKKALREYLFEAETVTVEEKIEGEIVQKTIRPEKVSDITTTYAILGNQLAVRFTYTENKLRCTRLLTIKDDKFFSLTYKAEKDEYKTVDEEKIFKSFEFIDKISEIQKSDLKTVKIGEKEYLLPIKATKIEGLSIDSQFSVKNIQPNYFSIVSLYDGSNPKYSAYVYNPKASVGKIGDGYISAISTDVKRNGKLSIYKGITIGTKYSEVTELIGSPSRQYNSEDDSTLTNIYQIEDVIIQLKFQNDDLTTKPDENAKVVAILVKVGI